MFNHLKKKLLENKDIFPDIVGQGRIKEQVRSALLVGHHIIISGPPGIGKTTLVRNIVRLLPKLTVNDCGFFCTPDSPHCPQCIGKHEVKVRESPGEERFIRLQGSPDLTAEDLLGDIDPGKAIQFGPLSIEAFQPGKIFRAHNGVLFFDEVNRAPEKLQNALLQALEEKKVTIGSYDVDLFTNFILIATMNPQDINTERLSDVFTDRFDFIYMDYPDKLSEEVEIVKRKGKSLGVEYPEMLLKNTVLFVRDLRDNKDLERKPSVRATLGLYERAQANAMLHGAQVVSYDDVRQAMLSVISHRITLKPSVKFMQTPEQFVKKEFENFSERHKMAHDG